MKYLLGFILILILSNSVYSQSKKEKYLETIYDSQEYKDMKYAINAYYIFKSDFTFKKSLTKKNMSNYNLVLNELNDNKNEKLGAFKDKFRNLHKYFSVDEVGKYFITPNIQLVEN